MKLDEKNKYFNEVYFSDLSDKAQNFLLKDELIKFQKQYDLSIEIIEELNSIINRIKDIAKILFIEDINTYNCKIKFYENVPISLQEIIKELNKLNIYIYGKNDSIKNLKEKLEEIKNIKNSINPSLIPFSDYDILKNVTTNNITQNNNENLES